MSKNDEYKVFVEVDGVVYRGRRSVRQDGDQVRIDGKLVGVDVDNDGNPLSVTLPSARVRQPSWFMRTLRRLLP